MPAMLAQWTAAVYRYRGARSPVAAHNGVAGPRPGDAPLGSHRQLPRHAVLVLDPTEVLIERVRPQWHQDLAFLG